MKHVIALLRALLLGALLQATAGLADGQTFEVVSVKVARPETSSADDKESGGPGTSDPGRFHGPQMQMIGLLERAFGVDLGQIQGPGWLLSMGQPSYDIDAIVPPNTTPEQFQKMLQNLLIERFHLTFHRETRNFPGYALVVDKGGPKIKEAEADPDSGPVDPQTAFRAPKGDDGFPIVHGSTSISNISRSRYRTKYYEQSMAQFMKSLVHFIVMERGISPLGGSPRILDKTGLTGKYTFVLECRNPNYPPDVGPSSIPSASDPADADDVFTAVRKQLGLRLDKTADVPAEVIVVESVDKTPTEN